VPAHDAGVTARAPLLDWQADHHRLMVMFPGIEPGFVAGGGGIALSRSTQNQSLTKDGS